MGSHSDRMMMASPAAAMAVVTLPAAMATVSQLPAMMMATPAVALGCHWRQPAMESPAVALWGFRWGPQVTVTQSAVAPMSSHSGQRMSAIGWQCSETKATLLLSDWRWARTHLATVMQPPAMQRCCWADRH